MDMLAYRRVRGKLDSCLRIFTEMGRPMRSAWILLGLQVCGCLRGLVMGYFPPRNYLSIQIPTANSRAHLRASASQLAESSSHDVDGDGLKENVCTCRAKGVMWIWINKGEGKFQLAGGGWVIYKFNPASRPKFVETTKGSVI